MRKRELHERVRALEAQLEETAHQLEVTRGYWAQCQGTVREMSEDVQKTWGPRLDRAREDIRILIACIRHDLALSEEVETELRQYYNLDAVEKPDDGAGPDIDD